MDRILQPQPIIQPEPIPEPIVAPTTTVADIPPREATSNGLATNAVSQPQVKNGDPSTPKPESGNGHAPKEKAVDDKTPGAQSEGGMDEIITQMFPDADKNFVKAALGQNPSLDDVRSLAENMAEGIYPKTKGAEEDGTSVATAHTESSSPGTRDKKRRGGFRSKLGKAFGLRGSNSAGATVPVSQPPPPPGDFHFGANPGPTEIARDISSGTGAFGPNAQRELKHEQNTHVSPANDLNSQQSLERMLQQQVAQSSKVNTAAINSSDTLLTSIPTELDRGETCEVINGQSLRAFAEYSNGLTATGIRLFASQRDPTSAAFMTEQTGAIEAFGVVLTQLAQIYGLPVQSIAIFHESTGNTIAFNLGRSVYYNLRFFYALHYRNGERPPSAECYSYWFITTAHELSHHLVSAHNKEHAFYTESYATLYLPKLASLIATLPQ